MNSVFILTQSYNASDIPTIIGVYVSKEAAEVRMNDMKTAWPDHYGYYNVDYYIREFEIQI